MKKIKNALTLKVFILIILTDVLESVAELFFKKGALGTGIENVNLHNFLGFILKIFTIPSLWLGIFFYVLNFFTWIVVLSRVDLSVAFPVGSFTYIIVPLLSIIFLHEKVVVLRWLGIGLIIIGVYLVSKSSEISLAKHES